MTGKERVEIALRGGTPDRVPVVPIFDTGYVLRSTDHDIREGAFLSNDGWIRILEESLLHHPGIDGILLHPGRPASKVDGLKVERLSEFWRVTNRETGHQYGLLPDGSKCKEDGAHIPRQGMGIESEPRIQSKEDIARAINPLPTEAELEESGRFAPLSYIAKKYPGYHFSMQSSTPMAGALTSCGGYVQGLTMLASGPALFRQILERHTQIACTHLAPMRKAGAHATLFTSYYTGADTISPKDYADIVFPYEYEICAEARHQGLFVLNWYLGDLMPALDKVMELPLDALVLEQGRKGYNIDPVEIRRRVGPDFCIFGFGYENDFCTFNKEGLTDELRRQIEGAGSHGAFVAGTPIMPPNAQPEAVNYYIAEVQHIGQYQAICSVATQSWIQKPLASRRQV